MKKLLFAVAAASLLAACPPEPAFDEAYRTKYQQVVSCQESADHALMYVAIWADEGAAPAYDGGSVPVPEGSTVVKEEFVDPACQDLSGFTVMKKDPARPGADGWFYQRLEADRRVAEEGALKPCVSCHRSCGEGRDGLCAAHPAQ